jgi:hypothetical protein
MSTDKKFGYFNACEVGYYNGRGEFVSDPVLKDAVLQELLTLKEIAGQLQGDNNKLREELKRIRAWMRTEADGIGE